MVRQTPSKKERGFSRLLQSLGLVVSNSRSSSKALRRAAFDMAFSVPASAREQKQTRNAKVAVVERKKMKQKNEEEETTTIETTAGWGC